MIAKPSRRLGLFLSCFLLCGFSELKTVTFNVPNADRSAGGIANVQGFLAKPDGDGPFPAIVILHPCGGVRPTIWPEFFVKLGYVSLTVDSFGSRGVGNCPNAFTRLSGLASHKAMAADAHGALDYLESLPFVKRRHIAVVGRSLGAIVIHFAILPDYAMAKRARKFRAAVSLYGICAMGPMTMSMARSPIPLLEIIGEKDRRILDSCKAHLPKHASTKLHILPGAYHAFDVEWFSTMRQGFRGAKMLYSETATKTARALIRDFLTRHMENGP